MPAPPTFTLAAAPGVELAFAASPVGEAESLASPAAEVFLASPEAELELEASVEAAVASLLANFSAPAVMVTGIIAVLTSF